MSFKKDYSLNTNSAYIIVAIISVIFGAILGWVVPQLFTQLTLFSNWLFTGITICCLITCIIVLYYIPALSRFSEYKYNEMVKLVEENRQMIETLLKHRAQIIPRELIYPEMAKCIRDASKEVVIVTYYMYDWENQKRTFLPPTQNVPGKEDFYEAIYECIDNPKVEYIRIWQVPAERKIESLEIIKKDPLHKKEIELIQNISHDKPDRARLIIADQHTTASFIIVDKKNLYINIDFYDKKENIWYSPYMIFIKDTTEQAFDMLNSIIVRLTSRINDN